jgi:hypothetical protein
MVVRDRVGISLQLQFKIKLDSCPNKYGFHLQSQFCKIWLAVLFPVSRRLLAIPQHVFDDAFDSTCVAHI